MAPKTLILCSALALTASVRAEVLLLDGIDQEAATASQRPARGLSMARVESQFGAPSQRLPAVGEPPITRWEYPNFTVYFEGQYVIHAVPHHQP
jgi:hypothetical protein